ncbi:hypothetical protein CHLNCDRAFT_59619 [Chlorella variabilis]|uniref:BI1-like protein n=1 Tax=Chlorella variabilis TaxID=554065 RepID=E1Z8L3_CHLVA|nr:hypothetical protein CHLNCDRAFT_59619 [Chlorella variabilis]EFN57628.1 hypothetical protein CHLNCDRAFT_59619 [Chlorella variabilis]|eukprot:XP_005849730.1 hypothetical protein CHLNCDRAFT_59619 [Chlorella variabilis]
MGVGTDKRFWQFGGGGGQDVETGMPLYPGADSLDNALRWGFIRKVYGIIAVQLVLTTMVAATVVMNASVQHFLLQNFGIQIALLLVSILALIPLYIWRTTHPHNLIMLGIWTTLFSVTVGMTCSFYQPAIVLEALFLTAAVVLGLTLYAFHATRQGTDLTFMGPALYGCLLAMVVWSFIQLIFPPGPVGRTIFALLGAILFSFYLVFDTQLLISRFDLDDYIWAAITIYLDIINLFLYLLRLLGEQQRSS